MAKAVQHENPRRSGRWKKAVRAVLFAVLTACLVALLSSLLTPSFRTDARYTVLGMYEQKTNTVQVAAFGASTMRRAFSPDYLFETYGLSAYGCCTSSQPPIASYYLLQDLLKSQGESLSVVLLDASSIVNTSSFFTSSVGAERVAACMPLSLTKIQYIWEMSNEYEDIEFIEQLIPVLKYHTRWSELGEDDYVEFPVDRDQAKLHGQAIFSSMFWSNVSRGKSGAYTDEINRTITESVDFSEEELRACWNDSSVKYMEKTIELCRQKGINVLLVMIPRQDWGDLQHDSVALFAQERGLEFADMALPSVLASCNLSYDTDYSDEKHPNLLGSYKLSDYLGRYLEEHFDFSDTRDGATSISDDDLDFFSQLDEDARLWTCVSLEEYLDRIDRDRYTVLISVKGEAADGLSAQVRVKLEAMGLRKLSELTKNESYVGVLDGGRLLAEKSDIKGATVTVDGAYSHGTALVKGMSMQPGAKLNDPLHLLSQGKDIGGKSEIIVDGSNKSENGRGINFVIYSKETGCMLDTASFDTHLGSQRTSDLVQQSSE